MNIAKKRYSSGYNISLFNKQDKKAEAAGRLAKAQREVKRPTNVLRMFNHYN